MQRGLFRPFRQSLRFPAGPGRARLSPSGQWGKFDARNDMGWPCRRVAGGRLRQRRGRQDRLRRTGGGLSGPVRPGIREPPERVGLPVLPQLLPTRPWRDLRQMSRRQRKLRLHRAARVALPTPVFRQFTLRRQSEAMRRDSADGKRSDWRSDRKSAIHRWRIWRRPPKSLIDFKVSDGLTCLNQFETPSVLGAAP